MTMPRVGVILPLVLALAVCAVAGCGSKPTAPATDVVEPGYANLNTLGQLYSHTRQQLGRPPKNVGELKTYAKEFGDIDRILVSPTDREPYVIVWGFDASSTPDQYMIFAYEKVGSGGHRHVLTPSGTLRLSAEGFAKATFPPGHKP